MPPARLPDNETARLAFLRECNILDTQAEGAFEEIVRLACSLTGMPIAAVSLVDETRQWFKSIRGLDVRETPRRVAFCAHAILSGDTLCVPDATRDPRFRDNELVTDEPGIRSYHGVPLMTESGLALGSLCVIGLEPGGLTVDQLDDLRALAAQTTAMIELRRANAQLKTQTERAESAARAKSSFLAAMSHEIRTPLTSVLGYLDLLTEPGTTQAEREEHADVIRRSATHLLDLINSVLDHAKLESGRAVPELAPCTVVRKLVDMRAMFAHAASKKGVDFQIALDSPVPTRFACDPARLRQVLVNLCGNAVKFTRRGSITLRARAEGEGSDARVVFEVTDTGGGIAPDRLDTIFDPFNQNSTSTGRRDSTGLGLCLSRTVARMLGGDVAVRSEVGVGSAFTFWVPARDAHDAPWVSELTGPLAQSRGSRMPMPGPDALRGVSILLAEDGPENRMLFELYLRRAGASVTCVGDGLAALRTATDLPDAYDLVLMDMNMPIMTGYEASRELRKAGFVRPILALTAQALADDAGRCIQAGCDEYLSKPIDRAALIAACAAWAGKHEAGPTTDNVAA